MSQREMHSVFTYDHDPPRVSSPWRGLLASSSYTSRSSGIRANDTDTLNDEMEALNFDSFDELKVEKLDAEPQEGPTEYKVHLLLRPRQVFITAGNAGAGAGSRHVKPHSPTPKGLSGDSNSGTPPLSHSSTTRQHRLEQLTTQLLWRLQQSSPLHTTSANNLILPSLPDATGDCLKPREPVKLLPGLEESNGALYEIGVSDDGTLVGLTESEMQESLTNLQAMAACLGCATKVLRTVRIGSVECVEGLLDTNTSKPSISRKNVYVAEAYIKPILEKPENEIDGSFGKAQSTGNIEQKAVNSVPSHQAKALGTAGQQLRVTLTGATTSGKSSLLGTLSMSKLDNGRGQSRLSLLKHRHELASGMTSSVAQELIGYPNTLEGNSTQESEIVNYARNSISSWNDIHAASKNGRLAFISDSAGHPRYRRTTVRGILGWAPHWTFLCIPASDSGDVPGHGISQSLEDAGQSFAGASAHISMAQLDLCLRLNLPLAVVITKLDVASKANLRQILSSVLSTLKMAGRKPIILSNESQELSELDLQKLTSKDSAEAQRVVETARDEDTDVVPIVFTSVVNGIGIGKVHALLRHLPIRLPESINGTTSRANVLPAAIFNIDDVFNFRPSRDAAKDGNSRQGFDGAVISGHLAKGEISVGQEMILGPFSSSIDRSQDESEDTPFSNPADPFLTPRSFTDALARATAPPMRADSDGSEWRKVKIVSARNLRLPVERLHADRVGTLGVVALDESDQNTRLVIRRGMILIDAPVEATHTFTASFHIADASSLVVGNRVVIYTASVRSSAKVVAVALEDANEEDDYSHTWREGRLEEDLAFDMDDEGSSFAKSDSNEANKILVTLQLDSYREWIEKGARLLVMPGGGPGIHSGDRGIKGLAGLEGFVGRVVETFG